MTLAGDAYPAEWFAKAEQDMARVQRRLDEGDTEDAAFHLQQAVEKALKGYLLGHGWKLRKIHDVEALLDEAIATNAALEMFRTLCQQVTGYYLIERYPGVVEGPSHEDIVTAAQQATRLLQTLLGH